MSVSYRAVNWNRHKLVYDLAIGLSIVVFIGAFVVGGKLAWQGDHAIGDEILIMRALGVCAIVMLHVILCIGPLARLDRRAAPLLYNRRHLGVCMFLVSLAHAGLAILYYGGFGNTNPASALLGRNTSFSSVSGFPFEWLGAIALVILFLMASTSHDFWLKNLSPRVWKRLHMLVYVAYALLVGHVLLGVMQSEASPVYPVMLGAGVLLVGGLHVTAGWREWRRAGAASDDEWIDVCHVADIPPDRAKRACLADGRRVAVFRHDGGISAMSDVCAHQGGPLSEGKVIDGCVTCPWHGYQYVPASGSSPPPFTEKIPTYEVRIEGTRVMLKTEAFAPGTPVTPAPIPDTSIAETDHG